MPALPSEGELTAHVPPYATREYAQTLRHVGQPLFVPPWGTWVIVRDIASGLRDAMGTYPVACLAEDADLEEGLALLRRDGLVSVTLVVDGLRGPPLDSMRSAFGFWRPFKTHYLVDQAADEYRPSRHHQLEVRRAQRRGVTVQEVRLADILDGWVGLYRELTVRHRVGPVQSFPRDSFVALLACEGLTAIGAFLASELVACHLWFEHDGLVRSHLGASNADGYASSAAYAVYDYSLRRCHGKVASLGGAAGANPGGDDGLARFKAGFSNATGTSYVLGSVLDPVAYTQLSSACAMPNADGYFPAYRAPRGAPAPSTVPAAEQRDHG